MRDKLDREINHNVMGGIDKIKSEIDELKRKRKLIQRSKAKIDESIVRNEERKKLFLERVIQNISDSFSSIFSTLLPQAGCKLVALRDENTQCFKGIEVSCTFS